MRFRDLTAEEIDCRIQSVKQNGLILLLYKDARCDMNILDETVGAENWQREHYECKGNLFCRVGINTANGWVWKADCGVESNTEAQKGESSDSFKRACFCWGLGRELYTAPFIWIPIANCNIRDNKCYDKFTVDSIVISNKKITSIRIFNENTKSICYEYGSSVSIKNESKIKDREYELSILCGTAGVKLSSCNDWLRYKSGDESMTWEEAPDDIYNLMVKAIRKKANE